MTINTGTTKIGIAALIVGALIDTLLSPDVQAMIPVKFWPFVFIGVMVLKRIFFPTPATKEDCEKVQP